MWSRVFVGIAGLVLFAGIGVAGLLYVYSPAELARQELIRQVMVNTGRELRITGGAHVVFYPSVGVSFGKVELANPPGMAAGVMLAADRIDFSVALLPLLSRQVHVERVALVRPVISLRVDQQGRQNWQFAQQPRLPVRFAQLGSSLGALSDALPVNGAMLHKAALPGAAGEILEKLELRSVSLTQATVRFADERSGDVHGVDELDVHMTGRRIADPLSATGNLVWQNERVSFDARLDALSQILAGRAANARVTVAARPLSAGFDGNFLVGDGTKLPEMTGQTRLAGESLASAARWLGIALPNAAPLGGFQVSGRMVASTESVALNGATFAIGQTKADGVVLVAFRKTRPYLSTDLNISDLDIDRLSAGFAGAEVVPRAALPLIRAAASPAATGSKPQSIEDLLRQSQEPDGSGDRQRANDQPTGAGRFAPQVKGYTNRGEWNSEPIASAALGLLDVKARLKITGAKVNGLSIERTVLRVALTDTVARVDIDDLKLYGGSGQGIVTAEPHAKARGARPATGLSIGANLRVENVSSRALMNDAAGFDRLEGRGEFAIVVKGSGESQHAVANSLSGTARFAFADGAVVGWNVASIMRGLQRGQLSNLNATPSEKTDFSELAASFVINAGTATTNDLRLASPLLRVSGRGDVAIGTRQIDLTLRPRLVGSLSGQGATGNAAGLEIPFKLSGPWDAPSVSPDFAAVTQDPGRIVEQAKELGRQFKGKSVGDIVRGVLGDGERSSDTPDSSSGERSQNLLNQFLRR